MNISLSYPYNEEVFMKIIDTYNIYKEKYREYVVLIKSGIFYSVYNDDVSIIYWLYWNNCWWL